MVRGPGKVVGERMVPLLAHHLSRPPHLSVSQAIPAPRPAPGQETRAWVRRAAESAGFTAEADGSGVGTGGHAPRVDPLSEWMLLSIAVTMPFPTPS